MSRDEVIDIPNTKEIEAYMHCNRCLTEIPLGESPESYARLSIGFTPIGIQVWCVRHDANILHVHFEGQRHPSNQTRQRQTGDPTLC